jgi:hypothetical protein
MPTPSGLAAVGGESFNTAQKSQVAAALPKIIEKPMHLGENFESLASTFKSSAADSAQKPLHHLRARYAFPDRGTFPPVAVSRERPDHGRCWQML